MRCRVSSAWRAFSSAVAGRHLRPTRLSLAVTAVLLLGLAVGDLRALSGGITGYSGKDGSDCGSCHSGGQSPAVTFEGPQVVVRETPAAFRFAVTSQSERQNLAGFDIAASGGDLEAGEGSRLEGAELTHIEPLRAAQGIAVWEFGWRAPAEIGTYILYGAGLSANGNGNRSGDGVATATYPVFVLPDANCDGRVGAADLVAAARSAAGDPVSCARGDADCDEAVGASDLEEFVRLVFDPGAVKQCAG